jgi:hypothetical protein
MHNTDVPHEVTTIIKQLIDLGLTNVQIAEKSGNRVSARTIHRWARGGAVPKQAAHVKALKRLLQRMQ